MTPQRREMTLRELVTKWRVENRSYSAASIHTPHLLLTPQEIDEAIAAFMKFFLNGGSDYLATTLQSVCKHCPYPEDNSIHTFGLRGTHMFTPAAEPASTGAPEGGLEFHVRINKGELKPLISDELAEQCKPGEDYATVVENLFANVGIKSALVMRVYGNQEG